jgi:O-palmitoleoyl-L-serine hydrolase
MPRLSLPTAAVIAAAAASTAGVRAQPLSLTVLPQAFATQFGAACLDGTPPAYWLHAGDPAKWVFLIEGGGWCFDPAGANATITACAARAAGGGGSSNGLAPTFDVGGLLSPNATINPHYAGWTQVFVHYCDGTSHSSDVAGPVPVPPADGDGDGKLPSVVHFRGRANLRAVFGYLLANAGLAAATDVILSGGSAGALTVYLAIDEVATWLPPGVRLVGAPDAGFFQDAPAYATGAYTYRNSFIAADGAWNATAAGTLNADCLSVYAPQGQPWRCFLQQYAAPYVRTPLFVGNSALDMWQVLNDLSLGCVPSTNGAPVAGQPSCGPAQLDALEGYRQAQLRALAPTLAGYPGTGAFVDTCFVHEQNVDYCSTQSLPNCVGFNIYTVDTGAASGLGNVTLNGAFAAWHAAVVANWDAVSAARTAHRARLLAAAAARPPVAAAACRRCR